MHSFDVERLALFRKVRRQELQTRALKIVQHVREVSLHVATHMRV